MTSLLFTLKAFFATLENALNERLSILLFGSEAEQEFSDIQLPSEKRQEEPHGSQRSDRGSKKQQQQLRLFFSRPIKRGLYKMVLFVEGLTRKKQTMDLSQNSYFH